MQALGIHTGADLRQWSEADLGPHFGKARRSCYRVARADDPRPVNPHRERKSVGAERSFPEDLDNLEQMIAALQKIAAEVAQRLQKNQHQSYTLTLKVKYADYQQITRSQTVNFKLQDQSVITELAIALLRKHLDLTRKVRLLGLTVANFDTPRQTPQYQQLHLSLPPFFPPDPSSEP